MLFIPVLINRKFSVNWESWNWNSLGFSRLERVERLPWVTRSLANGSHPANTCQTLFFVRYFGGLVFTFSPAPMSLVDIEHSKLEIEHSAFVSRAKAPFSHRTVAWWDWTYTKCLAFMVLENKNIVTINYFCKMHPGSKTGQDQCFKMDLEAIADSTCPLFGSLASPFYTRFWLQYTSFFF